MKNGLRRYFRSAIILALAVSSLIPFGSCAGQSIAWLDLTENQTVWGIVRLRARTSSGARDVSFDISYLKSPSDQVLEEAHLVVVRDGSEYVADWFTAELPNGICHLYARAELGGRTVVATLDLDVQNKVRADSIPAGVIKLTPQNDPAPPQLVAGFRGLWQDPVPAPVPVNSAGAEDSPFITSDGRTLYFWFNGDESKDALAQTKDPMTGVYWTKQVDGKWQEPQRLWLQYYDKLGYDGAPTASGNTLWFCSIRPGKYRDIDMWTAQLVNGRWMDWANAGKLLNQDYQVGEMHLVPSGTQMYFDSSRTGGSGGKDIWVTSLLNGQWQEPVNVAAVNTAVDEGQPFVSDDGNELWFTRLTPGPEVWRSLKIDGQWQPLVQPGLPPEHEFVKQWVVLFHGEGRPYLLLGTMIRPPKLIEPAPATGSAPPFAPIMLNAFRALDGSEAAIVANATDEEQNVRFQWQQETRTLQLPPRTLRMVR